MSCKAVWPQGPTETDMECNSTCNVSTADLGCRVCAEGFIDNGSKCLANVWVFGLTGGIWLFVILVLLLVIVCLTVQRNNMAKEVSRLKEEGAGAVDASLHAADRDDDTKSNTSNKSKNTQPQVEEEQLYEDVPGDHVATDTGESSSKMGAQAEEVLDPIYDDTVTHAQPDEDGERDSTYDDLATEVYTNAGFEGDIPLDFQPNLEHVDTKKDYFPWSRIKAQAEFIKSQQQQQQPDVEKREANPRNGKPA